MASDRAQAIRSALDAIPGSPPNMAAEACIETTLRAEGWHVIPGGELPVARWNDGKPHRCPCCDVIVLPRPRSSWRVYSCCSCGARFARWPRLARLLPFAGIRCSEHRKASHE